jgi:2-polyprenyl-3-methyl-5-hydroxy-6-metoxy-1,4-benzoquinol methylase
MSDVSEALRLQQTLYASRNPTRRWLHHTRRDWIISALRRHARQCNGAALEVGFGSGIYLPVLAELYDEVVGIDLQAGFVRHVREFTRSTPNIRVIEADINRVELPAESFDLILCTEVVEHLSDSRPAIAEMYRMLRPEGVLLLSTPQPWSPLELSAKIAFLPGIVSLVRLIYREPILETGHINLMSQKKLTRQVEAAGFTIRERFTSGVYLPVAAESLGRLALRCEQWLEERIRGGLLEALLWEQYYVAGKSSQSAMPARSED